MEKINDKLWSWAENLEANTLQQAERTSRLPIIADGDHVALMPDAHLGYGATVGSVIPTEGTIIPSAVGVDIGCGMAALETNLTANDLPDNLDPFVETLRAAVPAGLGQGHTQIGRLAAAWMVDNPIPSQQEAKLLERAASQLGTLGSGNHFVEVCLDERDVVWLMLHSGSRGVGKTLAEGHIRLAKQQAKAAELGLEDYDLAWFATGTPEFRGYMADLMWAQSYALENRSLMLTSVWTAFGQFLARPIVEVSRVSCHHNYVALEEHYGRDVYVTRKGAIRAGVGDLGLIPGSMATGSYIVRGLGNPMSYESCSHGAGRRLSRTEAKRQYTADDLAQLMQGKSWLSEDAAALVDEIPHAYKDIAAVMAAQSDLVEIVHELHQVLNYKGTDKGRPVKTRIAA